MAATSFPTFSLENHLSLRPRQYLNQVFQIAYAKRFSEHKLITAALNHCVGHAKTLIDNEQIFSNQMSWVDFCHQFTTFFSKYLTFNELLEIFERMNQTSGEDVETFGKRLESMANTLAEMAKNTRHPEASIRAIVKDLVRIFVNGLIVGKDEVMKKNPKNLHDAVNIAAVVQNNFKDKYYTVSAKPYYVSTSQNNYYVTDQLKRMMDDLTNMEHRLSLAVTTGEIFRFHDQIHDILHKLYDLRSIISEGRLIDLHDEVRNKAMYLKKWLYSTSTQPEDTLISKEEQRLNEISLTLDRIHTKIRGTSDTSLISNNELNNEVQNIMIELKSMKIPQRSSIENLHSNELSHAIKIDEYLNDIYRRKAPTKSPQLTLDVLGELRTKIEKLETFLNRTTLDVKSFEDYSHRVYQISQQLGSFSNFPDEESERLHSDLKSRTELLTRLQITPQTDTGKAEKLLLEASATMENLRRDAPLKKPSLRDVLGEIGTKIEELELIVQANSEKSVMDKTSSEDYSNKVDQINQQLGGFSDFPDQESKHLHSKLQFRTKVLTEILRRELEANLKPELSDAEKRLLEASTAIENLKLEVTQFAESDDKPERQFLYLDDKLTKIFFVLDSIDSSGRDSIRIKRKQLVLDTHELTRTLKNSVERK